MNVDARIVGANLKAMREVRGKTLTEVGDAIGARYSRVALIEAGGSARLTFVEGLLAADFLDCPPRILLSAKDTSSWLGALHAFSAAMVVELNGDPSVEFWHRHYVGLAGRTEKYAEFADDSEESRHGLARAAKESAAELRSRSQPTQAERNRNALLEVLANLGGADGDR